MGRCQFSEDEFEDNLLYELRSVYGRGLPHFKPSRTLENRLGYDFAVDTSYGPFAGRSFNLQDPRLVGLYPSQVRAAIPNRYVSGLVQCKVPYRVEQTHARTARMWNYWRSPFYKWPVAAQQAGTLALAEQNLGTIGIVRYAAPCFHLHSEMAGYVASGDVVLRTHFCSPGGLAKHRAYTYSSAMAAGHAFSEPEQVPAAPLLRAVHAAVEEAPYIPLARHIALLWDRLHQDEFLWDEMVVSEVDREVARIALGELVELPLDPTGILKGVDEELTMGPDGRPPFETLGDYAATIFSIQRTLRAVANCAWLVFSSPSP